MSMPLPPGATPLSARHFKPRAGIPLSSLPATARLGSRIASALAESLQQIAAAPWRTALEAVEEGTAATGQLQHALRFETSIGSIPARCAIDATGLSALVEAAMGGSGSEEPLVFGDRPPSAIERGILELAHRELGQAIAAAMGAEMARTVSVFEAGADAPGETGAGEWLSFRFLMNLYGYSGEMTLTVSKPELAAQLDSAKDEVAAPSMREAGRQALQREVAKADLVLTATLAEERFLLSELMAVRPGSLLRLRATAATPAVLGCGGRAVFEGRLARNGDRLAVTVLTATG